MKKIIECVPNFSEGRNKEVIEALSDAVLRTGDVTLLDVDPGHATNRTVVTFVGDEHSVVEAALRTARVAFKLIDMTQHKGEHPRMGAMDVCPFIPVQNASIEDCVNCALRFGERLAEELEVPVFLYGAAAKRPYRQSLPQVRADEYEGLQDRLQDAQWAPDFGPAQFVPSWGATACGARNFLIAYNVNLLSTKEQAHRIALNIREQGRGPGQPGRLSCCQAIGWYLDTHDLAQVSINLTDYHRTSIHTAFEECKRDAAGLKLAVTGSEIVGMVPLEAILMAARYYIETENLFILEEKQKVRLVVERLGLNSISIFDPEKRIIEYRLPSSTESQLVSLSVTDFVHEVGARLATPGGGSVAALCGTLGASLASMVGKLSYGKRQWEHLDADMRQLIPQFHNTSKLLLTLVDADTEAYKSYMSATRLPSSSASEQEKRQSAIREAARAAVNVPLKLMEAVDQLWPSLRQLAALANMAACSDLQMACRCLKTASWGARDNVLINLEGEQEQLDPEAAQKAKKLAQTASEQCQTVLDIVESRKSTLTN